MEQAKYIWDDGELIPWEEATVHFLSHTLHYGTGVFEGIRAYETADGSAVFRLQEHMVRLEASARAYGIPMAWSADDLNKATLDLLRANELTGAYIRPLVFHELGQFGLNPAGSRVRTMMAAFSLGSYLGDDGVSNGIRAKVSSWRRISHAELIPTAKGAGGYLNSALAKSEAVRGGYDEAIMLNGSGSVSEGSGMNIFLVMGDKVVTPSVASGILKGITRDSVIELLQGEGIEVEEIEIPRGTMYMADEIFLTGTAAEVTPVVEVDDRIVGAGSPGPVTNKAKELFSKAARGELEAYTHWLEVV